MKKIISMLSSFLIFSMAACGSAGSEDDYAWLVHYFNGYAGECPKNFTNVHALAVHELVGQVF